MILLDMKVLHLKSLRILGILDLKESTLMSIFICPVSISVGSSSIVQLCCTSMVIDKRTVPVLYEWESGANDESRQNKDIQNILTEFIKQVIYVHECEDNRN